MKTNIIFKAVIILFFLMSCGNSNQVSSADILPIISKLLEAEKSHDQDKIRNLFSPSAILSFPDSPPFSTNTNISSMYAFMWDRNNPSSISYNVDSLQKRKIDQVIFGTYHFSSNSAQDSLPFKLTFSESEGGPVIDTLLFGSLMIDKSRLKLPKPTGNYSVGLRNYSLRTNMIGSERIIGYQVWFPKSADTLFNYTQYHSRDVLDAISNFQGWPLFMVSHLTLIETNSVLNASVVSDTKFPLLVYNHGYGGFSSVYQTVFEDLASHGYIVVSLGHENESALQIINDTAIVKYESNNTFYSSRESELNGDEINRLQSVILNSSNAHEVSQAYGQLIQQSPLHAESVKLWALDTREVISDLISKNEFRESIDAENMGTFGHSVGGATAGELCSVKGLFRAGINLDGFQFGGLIDKSLQCPFLFVSSNQAENRFLRYSPFRELAKAPSYHFYIKGFEHSTFTDQPFTLNNNKAPVEIQRNVILDFFNFTLKGVDNGFPNNYSQNENVIIYPK